MEFAARDLSEYRSAFAEFAQKARQAQALMAEPHPDRQAIDAALLELEKARVEYNHRRDALAEKLLPVLGSSQSDSVQPQANRVSEVAQLRWELEGRPEGSAEEDWYRAEEIVRLAEAA